MDASIALILVQDGIVNGAIYALLALSLVLVFAVTRVVFIPQGEFVAYGALTYAALDAGQLPGSVWLLCGLGAAACIASPLGGAAHIEATRHRTAAGGHARTARRRAAGDARTGAAAPGRVGAGAAGAADRHADGALPVPRGVPPARPGVRAGAADRRGRRASRHGRAGAGVLRAGRIARRRLLRRQPGPRAAHRARTVAVDRRAHARADAGRCTGSSGSPSTARPCAPPR